MPGAEGPEGYPDYQRTSNWDAPLIRSANNLGHTGNLTVGRFNCSRYGYLAGRLGCKQQVVKVTLNWWSAETGGVLMGTRSLFLKQVITNPLQIRIPNMGAWLEIVYEVSGGTWEELAILSLTNRAFPTETIPAEPWILNIAEKHIGAGEVLSFTPAGYHSGPVMLTLEQPAEAANLAQLVVLTGFATTRITEQAELKPKVATFLFHLPLTAWELKVTGGVSQNISLMMLPYLTGSN